MRRLVVVIAVACVSSFALLAATAGAVEPQASARAIGVQVAGQVAGSATSGAGSAGGFAYPGDGSVITVGSISYESRSRTSPEAGAFARVSVSGISLFGGEVTIGSVAVQSGARGAVGVAGGDMSASSVSGLSVAGQGVGAGENGQVALGDWGYLVTLQKSVQSADAPQPSYRGVVIGVVVRLTQDHGGLPAGSEIWIGYAEAAVQSGAGEVAPPAPEPSQPDAAPAEPSEPEAPAPSAEPSEPAEPADGRPSPRPKPSSPPREPEPTPPPPAEAPVPDPATPPVAEGPPEVEVELTGEGFVFPVYGPSSFSDDFNGPRASTGWHHGNDVFAPTGAPVLAVADGTLFLVGWNTIGGWRLWLRDDNGNEYYYAHLSAYSPKAVSGARVGAGDVLGFVGATGDAVGTPPHLHFEIHPSELRDLGYDGVIDPYEYLSAWRRLEDAPFDTEAVLPVDVGTNEDAPTDLPAVPDPGGLILGVSDIASVSGLDSDGLAASLAFPELGAEGAYLPLVFPEAPRLVGLPPGFASA